MRPGLGGEEMNDQLNTAAVAPGLSPEAALEARYQAEKEIADKHGYYYSVLSDDEKIAYRLALDSEGFEQEIALLKARMKCMLPLYPYNPSILLRILSILERLQKTQSTVFKKDDSSRLEKAVENVFIKHHLPLGLLADGIPDSPVPA
jgi:hypothetical protein